MAKFRQGIMLPPPETVEHRAQCLRTFKLGLLLQRCIQWRNERKRFDATGGDSLFLLAARNVTAGFRSSRRSTDDVNML